MTFNDLVQTICDELNLTSDTAKARVGRRVNDYHRRVTTALGMVITRRVTQQATIGAGSSLATFTPCEKTINVIDRTTAPYRVLKEKSIEYMRSIQPYVNSFPTYYAVVGYTSNTVTIEVDMIAQSTYTLYADVHQNATTLQGSQTPIFSESFHDILIHGPLKDEYRKMSNRKAEWQDAKEDYERRLSELRFWFQKSVYKDLIEGSASGVADFSGVPSVGSGGGGGGVNGALSYTQTGLITFDRTGAAPGSRFPFSVASGSDAVANLKISDSGVVFTDITTGNVSSGAHGFAPKSPADGTKYLAGAATPVWQSVKDTDLVFTDVTTNNVSAAAHGFAPKMPNDVTKFLRGDGTWVQPFDKTIADTSTGSQNNWAPGISGHSFIVWNGASDTTITGMASGVTGQQVLITNKSATKVMYFLHQSGSSSAGNKFRCISTSTNPGTPVAAGGWALFEYDGTDWRLVNHDQGAWIDYSATSTVTGWAASPTVHIGYRLVGSTVFVIFEITGTSNATSVSFTLPFSVSLNGATDVSGALGRTEDNTAFGADVGVFALPTGATVNCYKDNTQGAWTNVGTKLVRGSFNYQPV